MSDGRLIIIERPGLGSSVNSLLRFTLLAGADTARLIGIAKTGEVVRGWDAGSVRVFEILPLSRGASSDA